MRFSRSKLDKVGEQTRGLEFTEASQDWVETAPRDETSITPPSNGNQVTLLGSLSPFFSDRSDAAEASGRPATFARETFNVQPVPKNAETIRNIAVKLPRNRTAPMVSRGLVPDDV